MIAGSKYLDRVREMVELTGLYMLDFNRIPIERKTACYLCATSVDYEGWRVTQNFLESEILEDVQFHLHDNCLMGLLKSSGIPRSNDLPIAASRINGIDRDFNFLTKDVILQLKDYVEGYQSFKRVYSVAGF